MENRKKRSFFDKIKNQRNEGRELRAPSYSNRQGNSELSNNEKAHKLVDEIFKGFGKNGVRIAQIKDNTLFIKTNQSIVPPMQEALLQAFRIPINANGYLLGPNTMRSTVPGYKFADQIYAAPRKKIEKCMHEEEVEKIIGDKSMNVMNKQEESEMIIRIQEIRGQVKAKKLTRDQGRELINKLRVEVGLEPGEVNL